MGKINSICVIITLFVTSNHGTIFSWNVFQLGNSTENIKSFAQGRISALRNLRNQLYNSTKPEVEVTSEKLGKEIQSRSIFQKMDKLLALSGPIKKMLTSNQGIESLASMVMPKRDVLQKLLEITGHLEPKLKRYLTDKYNGFLSSLVPYSENIGVPPYVLNSMKIPQGLDPRWQIIQNLVKSEDGIERFIHSVVSGEAFKKQDMIESRMGGDETDLISDQEPDATGQHYRRHHHHQQMYLNSFKKRFMKQQPIRGRYRLTASGGIRPVLDYENILDQNGQYSQLSYDVRAPDDITEVSFPPGLNEMDMLMSASGHGGGRGHGHGHGGGSHGMGFLDPFTILGGLAFLTYLGLLLQNSLRNNTNNMNMNMDGGGRRSFESFKLPLGNVKGLQIEPKRPKRSPQDTTKLYDNVINEMTQMWQDLEDLREEKEVKPECTRKKICKVVSRLKRFNFTHAFLNHLMASTTDHKFVHNLMNAKTLNMCDPYWSAWCK